MYHPEGMGWKREGGGGSGDSKTVDRIKLSMGNYRWSGLRHFNFFIGFASGKYSNDSSQTGNKKSFSSWKSQKYFTQKPNKKLQFHEALGLLFLIFPWHSISKFELHNGWVLLGVFCSSSPNADIKFRLSIQNDWSGIFLHATRFSHTGIRTQDHWLVN